MQLLLVDLLHRRIQDMTHSTTADATSLPALEVGNFYWLSCERGELESQLPLIQSWLQQLCGSCLLDLHVSDLLNPQIPSTFDYTSDYDVMLFRRLDLPEGSPITGAMKALPTAPVGYAVFDQLLLSVHTTNCPIRTASLQRLQHPVTAPEKRFTASRLPASSAELMLRQLNSIVDGYLNLRRDMAREIDGWQRELLKPRSRFNDWEQVLHAQLGLHQLDEICEDQRAAAQDWIDALQTWQHEHQNKEQVRALELLLVRSRDVLEHVERVIHHVHRMERSVEASVQMHFSAQSNRANDIMRTLTTLTAIFLPLNLIAAIFGMNFDVLPLVHKEDGFWWAMAAMLLISVVLLVFFWRRRYIERDSLLGQAPR